MKAVKCHFRVALHVCYAVQVSIDLLSRRVPRCRETILQTEILGIFC